MSRGRITIRMFVPLVLYALFAVGRGLVGQHGFHADPTSFAVALAYASGVALRHRRTLLGLGSGLPE